jgi:hypothetical protein
MVSSSWLLIEATSFVCSSTEFSASRNCMWCSRDLTGLAYARSASAGHRLKQRTSSKQNAPLGLAAGASTATPSFLTSSPSTPLPAWCGHASARWGTNQGGAPTFLISLPSGTNGGGAPITLNRGRPQRMQPLWVPIALRRDLLECGATAARKDVRAARGRSEAEEHDAVLEESDAVWYEGFAPDQVRPS